MGLAGNDHRFSGANFGSSARFSFVNPLYGLATIPSMAEEVYCNTYECKKDSNVITRLPLNKRFIKAALASTALSSISLLSIKYTLRNMDIIRLKIESQ